VERRVEPRSRVELNGRIASCAGGEAARILSCRRGNPGIRRMSTLSNADGLKPMAGSSPWVPVFQRGRGDPPCRRDTPWCGSEGKKHDRAHLHLRLFDLWSNRTGAALPSPKDADLRVRGFRSSAPCGSPWAGHVGGICE